MYKNAYANGLTLEVSIPLIQESLICLADVIEFIANGDADNLHDYDAWEQREIGGKCLYRLKRMLNDGELSTANCDLTTIQGLETIWSLLALLEHGSNRENPNEYRGPLFLPDEVAPNGTFREADAEYFPFEELIDIVHDDHRQQLMETKKQAWSWLPDNLRLFSQLLDTQGQDQLANGSECQTEPDVSQGSGTRIEEQLPESHDDCPIESQYRTREMTKQEAARYFGISSSESKNLQRRLNATIAALSREKKKVVMWSRTRQRWVFDYRIFPESVWDDIR